MATILQAPLPRAIQLDYRLKSDAPTQVLRLKKAARSDQETEQLAAHLLGDNDYDVLLTEDCDVYKPDGSLLAKLRQNVLSEQECVRAFPVWKDAAHNTFNRGHAAGKLTPQAVE